MSSIGTGSDGALVSRSLGEEGRRIRFIRLQLTLRIGLVGLAMVALWVTGAADLSTRAALTALVGLVYAPLTAWLGWRRLNSTSPAYELLVVGLDVSTGVLGVLIVPEMRTPVLFLYLMLVATETISKGRRQGMFVAAVTVTAAVLVDGLTGQFTPPMALGLLQFSGSALVLPVLISQLAAEHMRHAQHLARLHQALASIAATPDLEGTFDAIAETAKQAVGATLVSVMSFSDDRHTLSRSSITDLGSQMGQLPDEIPVAPDLPPRTPSELAVRTGRPVVVTDFGSDARFGRWAGIARSQGIAAMVAVPLATGDVPIGTLNAYWDEPWTPPDEDVDLLVAYAEGAALSILRARAYDREREAAVLLREAERMKSEFTAAITHELRTPLTTVRGFLETMLMHEDRLDVEDRRRMLEVSRRNAIDLSHRISALLEFSKLEADHVTVETHAQLLAPALVTTLDNCAGLLVDHELVVDVDPAIEADVDELALDHVVANLVSNAVKYAPTGSAIEVTADVAGDEVVVSVTDHGTGIPAEEVPHVFERFYRGADRGHGRRGTGIGLAIVQRYVELGGGRIWVESVEGEGATFRFTMPLVSRPTPPGRGFAEDAVSGTELVDPVGAEAR